MPQNLCKEDNSNKIPHIISNDEILKRTKVARISEKVIKTVGMN
jgi:hypothetical protein